MESHTPVVLTGVCMSAAREAVKLSAGTKRVSYLVIHFIPLG